MLGMKAQNGTGTPGKEKKKMANTKQSRKCFLQVVGVGAAFHK